MNRFALALVPALFAAPATAGNLAPVLVEPAPIVAAAPVAPVYNWTGPYAGVQVNYGDVRPDDDGGLDIDGDGKFYGLRAGYDYDFGRALVGGLVQYDKGSDIELGETGLEVDDIIRVGGRVGTTFGRNLVYATGGYARVGTDGEFFDVGSGDGYFAGAGYEALIAPNLSVGAEAIFHDFDDFDEDVSAKATTVGLNLNFRF